VDVLAADRLCLCGMLAAEYSTLPTSMRRAVRDFFDLNERWLTKVLDGGRRSGDLTFRGPAREVARLWTSALEGAMLLARSYGEPARLSAAARRMLAELTKPRARRGRVTSARPRA
jgi:TetR/AcrR family transcriptional repressor of nem operon